MLVCTTQKAEILSKENDQFHVEYANGNNAQLTYEEVINLLNKETEDGYHLDIKRNSQPQTNQEVGKGYCGS